MSKKGAALVLSLGVLAVLALIATSFAINMRLEYRMAQNFEDNILAKNLADMGIQYVIGEIRNDATTKHYNLIGDGWRSIPWTNPLDSSQSYSVTAKDCSSMININDFYNEKLTQILQNLSYAINAGSPPIGVGEAGQIISGRDTMFEGEPFTDANKNGYYDTGDGWDPLTQDEGFVINDILYGNGNGKRDGYFVSREKIKLVKNAVGAIILTDAEYNQVAPYITCYSYIDPKVIKPNVADLSVGVSVLQPRSPINLNTANAFVLTAILRDINNGTNSIDSPKAVNLANYIVANQPYKCWDDVWAMLRNAENPGGIGVIEDGDAAVVMASLNPNTDIMSTNPNASWRNKHMYTPPVVPPDTLPVVSSYCRAIGKNNLTTWATEGCFSSGGYYEITSTGTVTRGTEISVSKTITSIVKAYDIWRQTTQEDFETAGSTSNNVRSYPEPIGAGINNANYDGQIMLKDNEVSVNSANLVSHFNSFLDANMASTTTIYQNPNLASVVKPPGSGTGALLPDGAFSTFNGTVPYRSNNKIGYWPIDNISIQTGNECGVEMWVKTLWQNHDPLFAFEKVKKFFVASLTTSAPGFPVVRQVGFMWSAALWNANLFGSLILMREVDDDNDPDTPGASWEEDDVPIGSGLHLIEAKVEFPYTWNPGIWHHYVWKWNREGGAKIFIDGVEKGDSLTQWLGPPSDQDIKRWVRSEFTGFKEPGLPAPNDDGKYLCFGNDMADTDEVIDGTIDEIRTWFGPLSPESDYGFGRYYNYVDHGGAGNEANFVSSTNTPIAGQNVKWGTITWSAHLPIDLTDENGNSIIGNSSLKFDYDIGSGPVGAFTDPTANNSINQSASSVMYKATFTADEGIIGANPSLRDTPILDDVTITYLKEPVILSYKEQW